jgi:hypothetical protein
MYVRNVWMNLGEIDMEKLLKKKIFKYFDTCDDMQPKQAIKKASVKFDISKDVVENYYWKWRKQYVHLLKVEV